MIYYRDMKRIPEQDGRDVASLSFAQQAGLAQAVGWPQARYYGEEGRTVAEFLSYEAVYDINPFAIGVRRPETKKAFRARLERIVRLTDVRRFLPLPLMALSNGETRRVLLARALAKGPRRLVLEDPEGGLDPRQRARLAAILDALRARGVTVEVRGGRPSPRGSGPAEVARPRPRARRATDAAPVVEIAHLNLAFGRRVLFRDFSWTIRAGERWWLHGANGSGKTTLMALITGDSPLAYAADVKVFGQARGGGCELARIRRRMAWVSPEQQAYLGRAPLELLDAALAAAPELLILDEPFMNVRAADVPRAKRRIAAFLAAHPGTTAILISHRAAEVPRAFTRELNLDNPG